MAEASRWLELPGLSPDVICAEVRRLIEAKRDGPPSSFKYFTEAMCRLSAEITAPRLSPAEPQAPRQTEEERIRRLMALPSGAHQ